jgi:exopolysaccharide production protein ExoQ
MRTRNQADVFGWPDLASGPPMSSLVVSWLALVPLAVCAVHGAFSVFARMNGGLMVGSAALVQTNDSAQATGTRIVIRLTMVIVVLLYATVARKTLTILHRHLLLVSLVALAVLSILWSQDPKVTLQNSIYLIITTLFGFYLTQRFTAIQVMKLMVMGGWFLMGSSLFLGFAFPSIGIFHGTVGDSMGWQGIYPHKNELGVMTVYFLIPMLCLPARTRFEEVGRFAYFMLSIFLIAKSQSRGAWLICAAVVGFIVFTKTAARFIPHDKTVIYLIVAAVSVALIITGIALLPTLVEHMGKDVTLTGRTTIWHELMGSVEKQPLLGYGYEAFWLGMKGESAKMILAMHWASIGYAENGVLELCLELGFVGVGLFLAIYGQAIRRLIKLPRDLKGRPEAIWYASILFMTVITNIEQGSIAQSFSLEWVLLVITSIGLASLYRERIPDMEFVDGDYVVADVIRGRRPLLGRV